MRLDRHSHGWNKTRLRKNFGIESARHSFKMYAWQTREKFNEFSHTVCLPHCVFLIATSHCDVTACFPEQRTLLLLTRARRNVVINLICAASFVVLASSATPKTMRHRHHQCTGRKSLRSTKPDISVTNMLQLVSFYIKLSGSLHDCILSLVRL